MKKLPARIIYTSLATTIFVTSLTTHTFAQTVSPTSTTISPTMKMSAPGKAADTITQSTTGKSPVTTQLQNKKQAFLEKIATIKDEKKKILVEKIDTRIGEVNQNRTTQMSQALTKMNTLIVELTTKATLAKDQGQDVTKLNTAIATAQSAIKTAETTVTTQAAKEYTLTITTEPALKTTVGATVRTLQTDLRNTHAAVANAKQKVILAVVELAKLNGKSTDKKASDSAVEN